MDAERGARVAAFRADKFSLISRVIQFATDSDAPQLFLLGGLIADRWDRRKGRVMGVYGITASGMREFGGMQAGFLAEWSSAPFALEVGAVVVALVALFFLAPRLRRLGES